MKKLFVNFLLTSIFVVNAQTQTTAKGMKYRILKDVPGQSAKIGDVAKFHVIIQNAEGTVLQNSSAASPEPQVDLVKEPQFGWSYEEVFTLMSPGDSAEVYVPSDSIFAPQFGQQRPPSIPEHTDIKFVFNLIKVQSMQEFEEEEKQKTAALQQEEDKTILEFIKKNKLVFQKTESGLYYVQQKKATGVKAKAGDKVKVHYTGRLIDSTKFDSSADRNEPFEFELGARQVIQGWDEGIALMHKGEKGILIIPSRLGYGERGAGQSIKPNSILLFDVELLDITPSAAQGTNPSGNKPVQKGNSGTKKSTGTKGTGVKPKPSTKPKASSKTQLK
ncbi:MAG TPA: FKBP-type peptidyl-prolyl cis-trans isomerase [Cytophagales bacterium]|nr:FKBP-type peptidyl-prolyl cis-trans isomerase [Cytophagales bacterium]